MPAKRAKSVSHRISETEWEVMKVVWVHHPIRAEDIIRHLQSQNSNWHPVTAKTLINRLLRKDALTFKKEGRAYLYSPNIDRDQAIRDVTESFVQRVFDGCAQSLITHLQNSPSAPS